MMSTKNQNLIIPYHLIIVNDRHFINQFKKWDTNILIVKN
jgi:hypothetical protein